VDQGWIWTENLRPFLVELGRLTGYGFDDSDWIAVEYGIQGTDSEAGPWFSYPVGRIRVRLALEPGVDEIAKRCSSEQQRLKHEGPSPVRLGGLFPVSDATRARADQP